MNCFLLNHMIQAYYINSRTHTDSVKKFAKLLLELTKTPNSKQYVRKFNYHKLVSSV